MNLINIILALDENNIYGNNGSMPWDRHVSKISGDFLHFTNITKLRNDSKKNVIIMGKRTWENIKKPLVGRYNIIITSKFKTMTKLNNSPDVVFLDSLTNALIFVENKKKDLGIGDIFIIGGKQLWEESLDRKLISNVYITIIKNNDYYKSRLNVNSSVYNIYNNKIFCKHFNKSSKFQAVENDYAVINKFEYSNKEELIFLKTIEKIIKKGVYKMDRSGVGTYSIFGKSFTYDISNYRLPLFTHRKVFIRGIIEELLFFISGKTNTKLLEEKNVNIWKGHTSREYLNKVGLGEYKEGSYGPAYGFQLRHWGADFKGDEEDYTNCGIDQLEYIVSLLKNKETRCSRRILFSYWNPSVLNKVPLPSCHLLYNFFVNPNTEELSVSFYQRSNDYALAGVFNIVSASILTFMLCKITGLKPAKCVHNIGDLHLYSNQLDIVKEFMQNKPYIAWPFMHINNKRENNSDYTSMDEFTIDDFKTILYNSRKKYTIPFSV